MRQTYIVVCILAWPVIYWTNHHIVEFIHSCIEYLLMMSYIDVYIKN
jgi:hypothetical protein